MLNGSSQFSPASVLHLLQGCVCIPWLQWCIIWVTIAFLLRSKQCGYFPPISGINKALLRRQLPLIFSLLQTNFCKPWRCLYKKTPRFFPVVITLFPYSDSYWGYYHVTWLPTSNLASVPNKNKESVWVCLCVNEWRRETERVKVAQEIRNPWLKSSEANLVISTNEKTINLLWIECSKWCWHSCVCTPAHWT